MKSSPPSVVPDEKPKPLTRTADKSHIATQESAVEQGEAKEEMKEEPKEKSNAEAASTDHVKTLPVTTPPAGMSKKAMAKALETVKTTPCLSPEEQCKALGKTAKPKGRPRNKHAKAKAAPKAKSSAKQKAKTTRKAKAGDRKRKACKATETKDTEGMEEEEAGDDAYDSGEAQDWEAQDWEAQDWKEGDKGYDEDNGDHSHDTLPPASKTRKPRSKGKTCEVTSKAAPSSSRRVRGVKGAPSGSSSSSKPKTPKAKAKAKASSKKEKKVATHETTPDPDTLARKARLSRKSCASKKARREALNAGKTPEEAKAAAAKATWLLLVCV